MAIRAGATPYAMQCKHRFLFRMWKQIKQILQIPISSRMVWVVAYVRQSIISHPRRWKHPCKFCHLRGARREGHACWRDASTRKPTPFGALCPQTKKLQPKTYSQNGLMASAALATAFALASLTNSRWANSVAECKDMPLNLSTNPRLLRRQWPFVQLALADCFAERRQKLHEDVLSHATSAANLCLRQIRPGDCYKG